MTPAEELRAAATRLRVTASRTLGSDRPWRYAPGKPSDSVRTESGWEIASGDDPSNLRWIALVSPAVAEPIAAWLEDEGEHFAKEFIRDQPECPSCGDGACHHPEQDYHDGSDDRAGCERPFGGPGDNRCACFDHALVVARAINGRQS